jgi:hypothetical protein
LFRLAYFVPQFDKVRRQSCPCSGRGSNCKMLFASSIMTLYMVYDTTGLSLIGGKPQEVGDVQGAFLSGDASSRLLDVRKHTRPRQSSPSPHNHVKLSQLKPSSASSSRIYSCCSRVFQHLPTTPCLVNQAHQKSEAPRDNSPSPVIL